MTSGRDEIRHVLTQPGERPARALGWRTLTGFAVALLVAGVQLFTGIFRTATPASFLIVGVCVSLLLWGADRVWFSMAAPMFSRPFSIPAYVTRLPFWYIAGGIAFEASVLAAQALGLLTLYEMPMRMLFDAGARIGVASAVGLEAWRYRSVQRAIRQLHSPGISHPS